MVGGVFRSNIFCRESQYQRLFYAIGVLAVTRSLGDHTMKEFVVGNPYTTETELTDEDSFIILACDGVRISIIEM
jgi:serine/threonine protein phosphatase PrpC